MPELGPAITAMFLIATVLSPLSVIYCIIQLRRDAAKGAGKMMALGGIAVIATVATILYFAFLLVDMGRTGLGV